MKRFSIHMRHAAAFVAAIGVVAMLATACARQEAPASDAQQGAAAVSTESGKSKEKLTIVQTSETRDFSTIDPFQKDITLPRSLVFDTLLTRDRDGKLVPALAQSYEFEDRSWTIKLKQGIQFHNGDDFNAESVKATLDKILSPDVPSSTFKTLLGDIQETKVLDPYTVQITTKAPNYVLVNFLVDVPMLSAKQLAGGDAYKTELNGTGPYKLTEWKRGEQATLQLNSAYWGEKPPFRTVVVKNVPDEATRIAELLSGNADIAAGLTPASMPRIKGNAGYYTASEAGYRVTYLSYFFKPPFDNAKLRQAVYYAIDRQKLAQNLYGDYAAPALSPVTKTGSGYAEAFPLSDYSPDKAKRLIAEAEVKTPLSVDMDVSQADLDTAQIVQSQLKAVGIELKINTVQTAFDPKRYEQRANGSMLIFTGFDNPDREIYRLLKLAYSKDSFFTKYGYKPNEALDQAIGSYVSAVDDKQRLEYSRQSQELAKEDGAVTWLLHPANIYGISDTIDWKPDGAGRIDIRSIKVK